MDSQKSSQQRPDSEVNRLVTENFRLARFWAKKYEYRFGYNDALSLSMQGLLDAAKTFSEERGIPFGTYASVRIKWRMSSEMNRRRALRRGGDCQHLSLDVQVFEDGSRTLGDEIADAQPGPREMMGDVEARQDVRQMLAGLSPRNKQIMEMRFGLKGKKPALLEEIAQRFGLTRERVRQIEFLSLRKFRNDKHRKPLEPVKLARVA